MLGVPLVANPLELRKSRVTACAGWGLKLSGRLAARRAARLRLPWLRLEDGFLRSVAPGLGNVPYSIVVDDLGIYYDAARPSRLESLIGRDLTDLERARAGSLICAWRAARVSKYNHLPEFSGELPAPYVLLADQTFGDASIRYGRAGPDSFHHALQAALKEHPGRTVLAKVHPEVLDGSKRGYFDVSKLAAMPQVRVLGENVHPVSLIEHAEAVYTVTSQIGFEALLWGKPVRTFGMPFYAGWGLTMDELPAPARRHRVQLENLAYAALVDYPRYLDPDTGRRCEAERLIEWMGGQRRTRNTLSG